MEEPKQYQVGDLTMECVFRRAGLRNLSDMQAVMGAAEPALADLLEACVIGLGMALAYESQNGGCDTSSSDAIRAAIHRARGRV